jgi:hypothetical protein
MEILMLRLAGILFSLIATTLAGTAIVVVLTAGFATLVPIVVAAAVGAVAAVPVTWFVTKAIYQA